MAPNPNQSYHLSLIINDVYALLSITFIQPKKNLLLTFEVSIA